MSNSDMFRFYLVKNIRMETVSKNVLMSHLRLVVLGSYGIVKMYFLSKTILKVAILLRLH